MARSKVMVVVVAGFMAGALTVALFLALRSTNQNRLRSQDEVAMKDKCEKEIDADPKVSSEMREVERMFIIDVPTIIAHGEGQSRNGSFPSCVKYVRALLSDPELGPEERWKIHELELGSIQSDLSSIEMDLSSIESELATK
jgi:hypothetical protein